MKSTASLALTVGLVLSASATGQADMAPGPLARAVQREAVRLAQTSDIAPTAADGPDTKRSLSDWSRVVYLKPGAEITLTRFGLPTVRRHILSADESGLTVLNMVVDSPISAANKEVLVRTASEHPDYFFRARQGESILLAKNGNLRLTAEGVVEGDRTAVNLEQIVATVPRPDVAEIGIVSKHVGRHVGRGALVGAIVGGGVGGVIGATESVEAAVGLMVMVAALSAAYGTMFGAIVGAIAPRTSDEIYRARGAEAFLTIADFEFVGELIEIRDAGLVLLSERWIVPIPNGTRATKERRLRLIPYAAIQRSRFEQMDRRLSISEGRAPTTGGREQLRLVSRFPQGLSPEVLLQLLKEYGQTDLAGIQP